MKGGDNLFGMKSGGPDTDLDQMIERIRMELNRLDLSHPDLLKKSQQLDQLIQLHMKKKGKKPITRR
mgnify:CR=1 FL=1